MARQQDAEPAPLDGESCGWCDKPATTRVLTRRRPKVFAAVCDEHERSFVAQGAVSERSRVDAYVDQDVANRFRR